MMWAAVGVVFIVTSGVVGLVVVVVGDSKSSAKSVKRNFHSMDDTPPSSSSLLLPPLPPYLLLLLLPPLPSSLLLLPPQVAHAAVEAGADIINDVTGGTYQDGAMLGVVHHHQVPLVVMHMRGDPTTMMTKAHYHDVIDEVVGELRGNLQAAEEKGIPRWGLVVDPGEWW